MMEDEKFNELNEEAREELSNGRGTEEEEAEYEQ